MEITELVLNTTDKSKYIVMCVIVTVATTYTVNNFKELPSKEDCLCAFLSWSTV